MILLKEKNNMEIREYKPAHRKAEKSNQFEDLLNTTVVRVCGMHW